MTKDELEKQKEETEIYIKAKDLEISKLKKDEELCKLKKSNFDLYVGNLLKFRRKRNWALRWKKLFFYLAQFVMIAIYMGMAIALVVTFYDIPDSYLCDCPLNWYMIFTITIIGLATMIILGVCLSKFLSSMSSNLKADADANRKLNATIDEKVLGKMG